MGFMLKPRADEPRHLLHGRNPEHIKTWAIDNTIVERRHDQPIHFSRWGTGCIACFATKREVNSSTNQFVWTDDAGLYNRHQAKCNIFFIAEEL